MPGWDAISKRGGWPLVTTSWKHARNHRMFAAELAYRATKYTVKKSCTATWYAWTSPVRVGLWATAPARSLAWSCARSAACGAAEFVNNTCLAKEVIQSRLEAVRSPDSRLNELSTTRWWTATPAYPSPAAKA